MTPAQDHPCQPLSSGISLGFEKRIILRYLQSPRRDRSITIITRISIVGVALGVMALIVVLSVMNGFERDLQGALQRASGHLNLFTFDYGGINPEQDPKLLPAIEKHPQVVAMAGFTTSQALLMGRQKPQGALVKGIDPDKEPLVTKMDFFVRTDRYEVKRDNAKAEESQAQVKKARQILSQLKPHLEEHQNQDGQLVQRKIYGILLGTQLAGNLNVELGDMVTLLSPEERITAMGNLPRAKKFKVVGFFESGIKGYDDILAFIDLGVAQRIYRMEGRFTGMTIALQDGNQAEKVKNQLSETIQFPYGFTSWQEENKNLFAMFQLEKLGMAIILCLFILIAAFNIISSLIMLVAEKNKDIAILKAMGATNDSIRRIFIRMGIIIGLTGTLLGEILGLVLCWLIQSFDIIDLPAGVYVSNRIPVHVEFWQVGMVAVVSVLICFLVTIYPSTKAARLHPVEGLKHD